MPLTNLAIKPDAKLGEHQVRVPSSLSEVDAADGLGLRDYHGVFEPEETALCQQLINCGDRVLDIGANIGYYTLLFSDLVSPGGRVTAIEPDQDNFLCLQRNLADQVADGVANLHQVALGDETQPDQLFQADKNAGMHRLYASLCCSSDSTEVAVIRGDSLELGALDFIKIDIDGYEPAALRGLAATLLQSPRLKILCEFSPLSLWEAGFSPLLFLEEMRAYGFRLVVQDKQVWREGTFDEMEQALKQIPPLAVATLINDLKSVVSIQDITQQAAAFLDQHGYRRPLLENILLVANGAWQAVCNTLQIDQAPATDTLVVPPEIQAGWQCRWVNERDQDRLLSLFASAFGHSMPASLWLWKYAGLCKSGVLAHVAGKVVAHYGGLPRSLWLRGERLDAVQICDVMVDPNMRGILTRRGPFMLTAETFLRDKTGKNKPYRLAFGFPSDRAARLGEKLGLYARADTMLEVVWPTAHSVRLPFWFQARPLHRGDDAIVDALWKEMRQALTEYVLPQKDADFFRHRYLEHPVNTYTPYLVSWRWINRAVGVVVLRDHGPDQGMELMDLLGLPKVLGVLLKAAQGVAGGMGRQRVFGWLTPSILAALPDPATRTEVVNICIDPPALKEMSRQLHARWWLMSGDTDFR